MCSLLTKLFRSASLVLVLGLTACGGGSGGGGNSNIDTSEDDGIWKLDASFYNEIPPGGFHKIAYNGSTYVIAAAPKFEGNDQYSTNIVFGGSLSALNQTNTGVFDNFYGGANPGMVTDSSGHFYLFGSYGAYDLDYENPILFSGSGTNWSYTNTDDQIIATDIGCAAFSSERNEVAAIGLLSDRSQGFLQATNVDYFLTEINGLVWRFANQTYVYDPYTMEFNCTGMAYFNHMWIAIGANLFGDFRIRASVDGISWSGVLATPRSIHLTDIAVSDTMIVAVGHDQNEEVTSDPDFSNGVARLGVLYFSSDGLSWERVSDTNKVIARNSVISSNGSEFIAISHPDTHILATHQSNDGINWRVIDVIDNRNNTNITPVPVDLIWDGEKYVMLDSAGRVYSYDK